MADTEQELECSATQGGTVTVRDPANGLALSASQGNTIRVHQDTPPPGRMTRSRSRLQRTVQVDDWGALGTCTLTQGGSSYWRVDPSKPGVIHRADGTLEVEPSDDEDTEEEGGIHRANRTLTLELSEDEDTDTNEQDDQPAAAAHPHRSPHSEPTLTLTPTDAPTATPAEDTAPKDHEDATADATTEATANTTVEDNTAVVVPKTTMSNAARLAVESGTNKWREWAYEGVFEYVNRTCRGEALTDKEMMEEATKAATPRRSSHSDTTPNPSRAERLGHLRERWRCSLCAKVIHAQVGVTTNLRKGKHKCEPRGR
ncbi:unnamed protein product [Tilletia controversa]|nr:unnamed protein product [Tilletia controversa]